MTWWSQKDWADRFSQPDGPTGSTGFGWKNHKSLPRRSDFCGRKMAFDPQFQKEPFGWLIPLMGPITLWPKRKILRSWWPILKTELVQFGLIYDVMRDHLLRGGEFPVYRKWGWTNTLCGPTSRKLLIASNVGMLEKWLGHGRSWHGFSWNSGLRKCRY